MEFPSTHWSVLAVAARQGETAAERALSQFYVRYREPVRQFILRRGADAATAEDLTHDFFIHLIEKSTLSRADAARGRFRTFLLGALVRFLGSVREREHAAKRGGGEVPVSLDASANGWAMPVVPPTAAGEFDREWAHQVLALALQRLEHDYASRGRAAEFGALRAYVPGGVQPPSYEESATRLGLSLPALKTEVHRLRQRFRACLRAELATTVAAPDEIDAEIAYLGQILRDGGEPGGPAGVNGSGSPRPEARPAGA